MAVEIEADEVFRGLHLLQRAVFGTALAAIALVVIIVQLSGLQTRRLEELVAAKTAALKTEQSKLQSLFERAPNGLITLDAAGLITDFSVCASEIFGRNEDSVLGEPLQSLFAEPLPQLHDDADMVHLEINGQRPDGQLVPLELSMSLVQTEDRLLRLVIARDISEFKRLQRAMGDEIARRQAAESRQRLLLDAAGEGIFGLDTEERICFINPAGAQLLGYEPAELLGRTLTETVGRQTAQRPADGPLLSSGGRTDGTRETTLHRRDGSTFEAEFTRSPLVADGREQGWVVIFSDITSRKRAEQSLLLSENVFQHITEGIMVADASGRILRVNHALCDMVGYSEQELVGQARPPYRSGEHPPVFYQQLWDALTSDGLWEGEIWNRRKHGELFPTWQTIVAIRDSSGRSTQFVSVTRDITEQRRGAARRG